nr:hypothetical protein SYMBAF_210013 [Serratia symbiotica]
MTNQEFLALIAEEEHLQARYEASWTDPTMGIEERRAIAAEYGRKYRELDDAVFSRITPYKDFD